MKRDPKKLSQCMSRCIFAIANKGNIKKLNRRRTVQFHGRSPGGFQTNAKPRPTICDVPCPKPMGEVLGSEEKSPGAQNSNNEACIMIMSDLIVIHGSELNQRTLHDREGRARC